MARALEGFTGLEHVMEPVATLGGVRFVNDSKATNIDAAGRSIESFDRVVAIIGGRYKGGAFEDLARPLATRGRGVVAIGEARPLVRRALGNVVPLVEADSMRDAVARRVGARAAGWRRAAGAGVLELRHVCRLRGSRAGVQRGSAAIDEQRATSAGRSEELGMMKALGWSPFGIPSS